MAETSMEQQIAAPSGPIRGHAEGLAGVKGRLSVNVAGAPLGVLHVDEGELEFVPGETAGADVTVFFDDRDDVVRLLRGELNPVVALLQNRMRVEGNPVVATRIILGLRAGSSFRGERMAQGD
jgi:hypothetical protein